MCWADRRSHFRFFFLKFLDLRSIWVPKTISFILNCKKKIQRSTLLLLQCLLQCLLCSPRKVSIVNLDPANENMNYSPAVDVAELVGIGFILDSFFELSFFLSKTLLIKQPNICVAKFLLRKITLLYHVTCRVATRFSRITYFEKFAKLSLKIQNIQQVID